MPARTGRTRGTSNCRAGIDDRQKGKGIGRFTVRAHVDRILIHLGDGGQHLVIQVLLRHVVVGTGGDIGKAGIVLDQADCILPIDCAGLITPRLRDHNLDVALEQRVVVVRANLSQNIAVILQSLDQQLAVCGGSKDCALTKYLSVSL